MGTWVKEQGEQLSLPTDSPSAGAAAQPKDTLARGVLNVVAWWRCCFHFFCIWKLS